MPYVSCPRCNLRSYSAARYAGTDECPACGGPLVVAATERRRTLEMVTAQARRLAGRQSRAPRDMI